MTEVSRFSHEQSVDPSTRKENIEWWVAEVAMFKDRNERLERGLLKMQDEARMYEAYATALADIALRAGGKAQNVTERAALDWAEANPYVTKPKPDQLELAA